MVLHHQFYIWMKSVLWIRLMIFLIKKCRIYNKQLLVKTHACYYSQDITNKSHLTPSLNVLETGGRQLGTEIQKPNTN